MPQKTAFAFTELRSLIRETLRPVFQAVIDRESENGLYAFVLRTDDDGTIITAACNSERNLREQYGLPEGEDPPLPDDDLEYPAWCSERWLDEEWREELIDYGDGTFRIDEAYEQFQRASQDDHFGGVAYAAMVLAMRDLDQEGLFASANKRDAITLYCVNSDGCPWLPVESARKLNPAKTAKRFAKEWSLVTGERAKPSGPQFNSFKKWLDQFDKA
jgi:hypothetical protein